MCYELYYHVRMIGTRKIFFLALIVVLCVVILAMFDDSPDANLGTTEVVTIEHDTKLGVSRAPQTCLSPTFQGKWEQHTPEQISSGMELAASLGVETLHVGFEWGQVESSKGEYDWSVTDRLIGVGGLDTSVVVNMLDAELPNDIAHGSFGENLFTQGFTHMLDAFLQRYQDQVTHIWIGNEVNISLDEYGIGAAEYGAFYRSVVADIGDRYPGVQYGVIVTYAYEDEQIISDLIEEVKDAGMIGFTFYPQFLGHAPTDAAGSFDVLDSYAQARGIQYAVVETAWSTRGALGSEDNQVEYIKSYLPLAASADYPDRAFVCYWSMYDPSVPAWQKPFLVGSVSFLESLGLIKNDGVPKPGWDTFKGELGALYEP